VGIHCRFQQKRVGECACTATNGADNTADKYVNDDDVFATRNKDEGSSDADLHHYFARDHDHGATANTNETQRYKYGRNVYCGRWD